MILVSGLILFGVSFVFTKEKVNPQLVLVTLFAVAIAMLTSGQDVYASIGVASGVTGVSLFFKRSYMYNVLMVALLVSLVIGSKGAISVSPQTTDENESKNEEIANCLQNIDDDQIVLPKIASVIGAGNGETDLVKLYQEGRMFAKTSEREALIELYGKPLDIGSLKINKAASSERALEMLKSNKPKALLREHLRCSSCKKLLFDYLKDFNFKGDYEFVIFVRSKDLEKSGWEAVPENMRDSVVVVDQDDLFGLKRFPSTIFVDNKNRVFDIGGGVSGQAMNQRFLDIPRFGEE